MATLIRQFPGAQFNGSLILDLEPTISFPASTLGAYRLRNSAAYSAYPRAGSWPAAAVVDTGADPTFTPYSVQTNAGKTIGVTGQNMPSGNVTVLTVSRQRSIPGAGALQWLGGAAVNSTQAYGVVRSKDSLNAAVMVNGATYAQMTPNGGDRWEAIFATFNVSASQASLYRPRTDTTTTAAIPTPTIPAGAIRLLGNTLHTAPAEGALVAFFNGTLTKAELDAIYASAKASLAVSGIEI
ncbi:hypothetical protein [Stenotrophomonas sp. Sm10]|uniref:hypothetical protein n=1 Tax=Stenotrophomonas sp. Sm10 TaxID=3002754 RepID=UPI0027E4DA1F|nr:hypothetical protein [Stenotrophomonas sp. Sm10]MDQ7310616.1 hypothetical protein [Stenotrophomonas sp. Sm10]